MIFGGDLTIVGTRQDRNPDNSAGGMSCQNDIKEKSESQKVYKAKISIVEGAEGCFPLLSSWPLASFTQNNYTETVVLLPGPLVLVSY